MPSNLLPKPLTVVWITDEWRERVGQCPPHMDKKKKWAGCPS